MHCSLHTEPICSRGLRFVPSITETHVWEAQGSSVELNCTILMHYNNSESECNANLLWSKDGEPLPSHSSFTQNISQW